MTDTQDISFQDTKAAFTGKTNAELKRSELLFRLMAVPELTKVGTFLIKTLLKINFPIKRLIKGTLFRQFCGGETLLECQNTINQLSNVGIKSILDYAAEGEMDEKSYSHATEMIIGSIEMAAKETSIAFAVFKVTALGATSVLERYQLSPDSLLENELTMLERIRYRMHLIAQYATETNVPLLVDAEESWVQDTIDKLVFELIVKFNKKNPIVYNTLQCYRKDALQKLHDWHQQSIDKNFILAIKLVRGAYMEKENARVLAANINSPINRTKEDTDRIYNAALEYCVKNKIALCVGTHNENSTIRLIHLMKENALPQADKRIFFAQLYGMSDHISGNLAKHGYNVAKYVPFGPVHLAMPYLFRRAEENKSIMGQTSRELGLIQGELRRRKYE